MRIEFAKMHGLGNDFIVIDDLAEELELSEEAVAWFCDRNFGIGADGLMLVRPATLPEADFAWWFRNSDGSVAEMCGNGIRCFAKYVVDRGLVPQDQDTVLVETLVGVLTIRVTRDYQGKLFLATVDMGAPILDPEKVPTTLRSDAGGPVLSAPLSTEAGEVRVTCVSMGNPHAVTIVNSAEDAPVSVIGPLVENAAEFPRKTNVEFAEIVADDLIRLRVWERGCGETLACGTGACATTVACSLLGLTGREVTVELPGGDLAIHWTDEGPVWMTGPATEVYSGVLEIEEDDDLEA